MLCQVRSQMSQNLRVSSLAPPSDLLSLSARSQSWKTPPKIHLKGSHKLVDLPGPTVGSWLCSNLKPRRNLIRLWHSKTILHLTGVNMKIKFKILIRNKKVRHLKSLPGLKPLCLISIGPQIFYDQFIESSYLFFIKRSFIIKFIIAATVNRIIKIKNLFDFY